MSRSLLSITVVASTLHASVATAGISVDFVKVAGAGAGDYGTPYEDLNGTGWSSYQVHIATDDEMPITAVDVRFEGQFHQQWIYAFHLQSTPVASLRHLLADSHLAPVSGALTILPSEDNNVAGISSPLPDVPLTVDYGVGTFLSAAWGIPGAIQSARTPIALVVIPDDSPATFIYDVATQSGRFSGTSRVPVPESRSVVLAVAYLVGLIATRRTRS